MNIAENKELEVLKEASHAAGGCDHDGIEDMIPVALQRHSMQKQQEWHDHEVQDLDENEHEDAKRKNSMTAA